MLGTKKGLVPRVGAVFRLPRKAFWIDGYFQDLVTSFNPQGKGNKQANLKKKNHWKFSGKLENKITLFYV